MSVFVSYRREGGLQIAKSIYENLISDYNVFFDYASLRSGPFEPEIIKQIEKCDDFLLIITEDIFDRCANQNDWIMKECKTALNNNKNIIPIFINCTHCPKKIFEFEDIVIIDGLNGIEWSESPDTIIRIKSFLVGNKRYKLSIINKNNKITLSESSKNQLKLLYVNFVKNDRREVEIQLVIDDIEKIAELALRKDLVDSFGISSAKKTAQQYVLKKFLSYSDIFNKGIEHMLLDEMIDAVGMRRERHYLEKIGDEGCYILDNNGLEIGLWTVFVWLEIIDEMLKELIFDRYNYYGNTRLHMGIDCIVETKFGTELWSFLSFIKDDVNNSDLINKIQNYGGADYFDIPLDTLIYSVYPDLYINIGQLYKNNFDKYSNLKSRYKNSIFNLYYYFIKQH